MIDGVKSHLGTQIKLQRRQSIQQLWLLLCPTPEVAVALRPHREIRRSQASNPAAPSLARDRSSFSPYAFRALAVFVGF